MKHELLHQLKHLRPFYNVQPQSCCYSRLACISPTPGPRAFAVGCWRRREPGTARRRSAAAASRGSADDVKLDNEMHLPFLVSSFKCVPFSEQKTAAPARGGLKELGWHCGWGGHSYPNQLDIDNQPMHIFANVKPYHYAWFSVVFGLAATEIGKLPSLLPFHDIARRFAF